MSLDPAAGWVISQQETELDSEMEKRLRPGLRHGWETTAGKTPRRRRLNSSRGLPAASQAAFA